MARYANSQKPKKKTNRSKLRASVHKDYKTTYPNKGGVYSKTEITTKEYNDGDPHTYYTTRESGRKTRKSKEYSPSSANPIKGKPSRRLGAPSRTTKKEWLLDKHMNTLIRGKDGKLRKRGY